MAHNKAYYAAEEKIAEALRTDATELDLCASFDAPDDEKLFELPESLSQLMQLQSLDLSRNQLTELPDSLEQLKQIRTLNLNHNKLSEVPEVLRRLTHLQSLGLGGNNLVSLPEWLSELTELQKLSISDIELGQLPEWFKNLTQLQELAAVGCQLTELPEWLATFEQLHLLDFSQNQLVSLPRSIQEISWLYRIDLFGNNLRELPHLPDAEVILLGASGVNNGNPLDILPPSLRSLKRLKTLTAWHCNLHELPAWISEISGLESINVPNNQLTDLPISLVELEQLKNINIDDNPLNSEIASAYKEGFDAVKAYLRAKAQPQITLNEAKLILVGEGEVGKTCLMDALADVPWQEHDSTHGIQIRAINTTDVESGRQMTLNGWDFGGQKVYRPTHQLFFSSPAVYLVVWKPREGSQAGAVKEWIKLVKHREPDAKILVVATHGGPGARQPDIDRQELWDLFGRETVIDFFHVDSKPDGHGRRRGIDELKQCIAQIAAELPEMGREVPKTFAAVRQALVETDVAYLPLEQVYEICYANGMEEYIAKLFVTISHRLGHLIHYEHDPTLRDIVILKPDWLATAISFVLDDEVTRKTNGLVPFSRLRRLWQDPKRALEERYSSELHPIFLRLMERYDLSYRVAGLLPLDDSDSTSLIAQLVPDTRPEEKLAAAWSPQPGMGDSQQMQICRIVDGNGQSATAEGLFYQLIVRLHQFSLGRVHFDDSVHWQRGLVLDNDYNGIALLEHRGNDIHITVRAAYPQGFLNRLTDEVKYLVDSFWEGLRCDVTVRCLNTQSCPGLFEVSKLIENKKRGRPEQPCPICNEWQEIDRLLLNAPAAQPAPTEELITNNELLQEIRKIGRQLNDYDIASMGRFDTLDAGQKELLSKADASYNSLIRALTDEAREGPRLFSLIPVNRSRFNPREWSSTKFRLTLWCEHSRRPLPILNGLDSKVGVYEIELNREWFKQAAPFLKVLNVTLSLILPVATAGIKLAVDEAAFDAIEEQLDFSTKVIDASLSGSKEIGKWLSGYDETYPEHGERVEAHGAVLRELHAFVKEQDPGFGGLVRVRNKRQEFLWVHGQFVGEY